MRPIVCVTDSGIEGMALRMDVRVSTRDVQQFEGDALVVGVFSDGKLEGPAAALDEAMAGVIAGLHATARYAARRTR